MTADSRRTSGPPLSEEPLERSWLVQRLQKPLGFINPFAGARVSDGRAVEVNQVFDFDYMGCAEFEWGAVPGAMDRMAGEPLSAFAITLADHEIAAYAGDRVSVPPQVVYVLCATAEAGNVERRIRELALDNVPLLEPSSFSNALRGNHADKRLTGWLEIDNGFMFFTDPEMFAGAARLLSPFPSRVARQAAAVVKASLAGGGHLA